MLVLLLAGYDHKEGSLDDEHDDVLQLTLLPPLLLLLLPLLLLLLLLAGYDHEEGSSDEEQDDIFELEGMAQELDINDAATASALQQQMHEQQLAALQVGS
jgi:hypothetical protein